MKKKNNDRRELSEFYADRLLSYLEDKLENSSSEVVTEKLLKKYFMQSDLIDSLLVYNLIKTNIPALKNIIKLASRRKKATQIYG